MKSLGVIANGAKKQAPNVLARLKTKAEALGLRVLPDQATAELMGLASKDSPRDVVQKADTVMVLGGTVPDDRAIQHGPQGGGVVIPHQAIQRPFKVVFGHTGHEPQRPEIDADDRNIPSVEFANRPEH